VCGAVSIHEHDEEFQMMTKSLSALCIAASMAACSVAIAKDPPPPGASSDRADNTAMNERDRSGETPTSFDQPNNKADIDLAANVRKAIVGEKSLSTKAHNVKLIASAGVVTLRGPVDSADEKATVDKVVASVRGVSRVDNQLDIKQ
jgi:hyperosmotically inducible protein